MKQSDETHAAGSGGDRPRQARRRRGKTGSTQDPFAAILPALHATHRVATAPGWQRTSPSRIADTTQQHAWRALSAPSWWPLEEEQPEDSGERLRHFVHLVGRGQTEGWLPPAVAGVMLSCFVAYYVGDLVDHWVERGMEPLPRHLNRIARSWRGRR